MKNLTFPAIPQWLYMILLFWGGLFTVVSIGMIIYGIWKKRHKSYFIYWSVILSVGTLVLILSILYGMSGNTMA